MQQTILHFIRIQEGKLMLKRFYDRSGNFKGKSTFEYDDQSRLIRWNEFKGWIREYEYY